MKKTKNFIPKLLVAKSAKHIYAEIIDNGGKVLTSANSRKMREKLPLGEKAKLVGQEIAQKAKKIKIEKCVFVRRQYRYHGCVASLVEAAREGGLKI